MIEKLSPVGELDELSVSSLGLDLEQVPSEAELIVDFSGVTFCASVAMGALIQTRNRLNEAGGSLVIRNPQPIVQRALALAQLDFMIDNR